jgi:methyltransferase (TIGR00027 family)
MRFNKSSQTAQFVCLMRAMANICPELTEFSDPLAKYFLTWMWSFWLFLTRLLMKLFPNRSSSFPNWLQRFGIHMQFRTVVIDKALKDALPFEQLVILGAGLDSRAWRMKTELKNVQIYEVDFPSTQEWKREKVKEMIRSERSFSDEEEKRIHFVPVDFTKDKLEDCLEKHGYSRQKKTFWIWEGVTMYLEEENVKRTLKLISELSSGGGTIALTYLDKENGVVPASRFLSRIGEPFLSAYEPNEIEAIGKSFGDWQTLKNEGDEDWNKTYRQGKAVPGRRIGRQRRRERIWVGMVKGKKE